KTRLLLLFILSLIGLIGTVIWFFMSRETDQFNIFMSGLGGFLFLFWSIFYGRKYIREVKKTAL
ncbi:MAG: hypothetical protein ABIY35_07680, partial [Chitinophagaceae bacterium]